MRILFICRFLPYSRARDSGRLDTYHYIAALSEAHEVSLISFVTADEEGEVASMRAICRNVVAIPYRERALGARLYRAWRRLIQPRVYGRNHAPRYRRALRRLLDKTPFDVAVVDGVMAEYGSLLAPVPAVLDEVDIFSIVAHQLFRDQVRPLARLWAGLDWLRTTLRETHHVRHYAGVIVRSAKDETVVREFAPDQRIAVIPPWFEGLEKLLDIPAVPPGTCNLLFVGAMYIPANIDAVVFFARRVFPLLRRERPEMTFTIVGSRPAPAVRELAEAPKVVVTGEVDDLTPYYTAAAVVVVPLFTGGGIIVKTLNGLASGRPVVATATGNSGTGAHPGRDLLVTPSEPRAMAAAVAGLLEDEEAWRRLATNGRRFIRRQYDWNETTTRLDHFLRQVRDSAGVGSDD